MTKSKLLGQVFTPETIALKMVRIIKKHNRFETINLLDPCIGPATFLKALENIDNNGNNFYYGFDIDQDMICYSQQYAKSVKFNVYLESSNYLLVENLNTKPNAVIMNPPYVRHEWIDKQLKIKYKSTIEKIYDTKIDGKSNLYVYFLLKSFSELIDRGLLCILVYDAILSTSYGKKALNLVLEKSEVIYKEHIKTPFNDVLVDATLLVLRKNIKNKKINDKETRSKGDEHLIEFEKLVTLKRGIGLLNSKLFLADKHQKYSHIAKQFIKKQLSNNLIISKDSIKQNAYLFEQDELLNIDFLEWFTQHAHNFYNENRNTITLKKKITSSEKWYCHKIYSAPILFNYYIRNNPRFVKNIDNIPFSDNFYGILPNDLDNDFVWLLLNTPIYLEFIMKSSRNQGNGLKKIQLNDLKKALVPNWNLFTNQDKLLLKKLSINLKQANITNATLTEANEIVKKYLKGN